ncbi:MAG: alpha/beta hydrolase [Candidatus Binatia bacterium]
MWTLRSALRTSIWLALPACALVAGCSFRAMQRGVLYPGQYTQVAAEPPAVPGIERFRVPTSAGVVDAWYLPPPTTAASFPAMMFGHGNGEVIDMWVGGLDEFRRWGMAVMLVEYPGYGRSGGIPSEDGIGEAMAASYDVLLSRPGVDPARIVGYGQSLGGGAICALARERRLAAMVLQSTFTSLRPLAWRFFLPSFLLIDDFDNAQVVEHFDGPILFLHGRSDGLIPPDHAETLVGLARHGRLQMYDCGHGCWDPAHLPLYRDIHGFLTANGILPATPAAPVPRDGDEQRADLAD